MFNKIYDELILRIKADKYDFLRFNLIKQEEIKNLSRELSKEYDTMIIIGFGASSLNVRALISSKEVPTKKLIYLDTLDQLEINEKLKLVDINRSVFFSLSKSGNTNETYLLTKYVLEQLHISPQNLYVIAPASDNLLFNLAKAVKANCLEQNTVCSGRFGIISNAALLPAAVAGVDVSKVVNAATKKISDIIADGSDICRLAQYYLDQYLLNRPMLIMFNYCYQLTNLCLWQQQIIAESLGKNGFGITPIIAKGTFDQHSQLQLYLEGPDDKFYKIITNRLLSKLAHDEQMLENLGAGAQNLSGLNSVPNSNKKLTSQIPSEVACEKKFTPDSDMAISLAAHATNIYNALIKVARPVKLQNFTKIDEQIVVEQIIETMLCTIMIADQQKITAFDQPSVDKYKII